MYAGTANGFYKSSDGGSSWVNSSVGLRPYTFVDAIAVDPNVSTTIYVGTGNSGYGVYKSVDEGASWTAINEGLASPYVYSLAIGVGPNPAVYAGTGGGVFRMGSTAPDIEVTPLLYSFGHVVWGELATAVFTISNRGGGTLTLGTPSVQGGSGAFLISSIPEKSHLAAGESTTVEVTFAPGAIQDYSGFLRIDNGTYQCSDFTSGSWTLRQLKTISTNDVYVSILKGGNVTTRMYGVK